jgi:hypothetical protein
MNLRRWWKSRWSRSTRSRIRPKYFDTASGFHGTKTVGRVGEDIRVVDERDLGELGTALDVVDLRAQDRRGQVVDRRDLADRLVRQVHDPRQHPQQPTLEVDGTAPPQRAQLGTP